jgi:hypothetical protein
MNERGHQSLIKTVFDKIPRQIVPIDTIGCSPSFGIRSKGDPRLGAMLATTSISRRSSLLTSRKRDETIDAGHGVAFPAPIGVRVHLALLEGLVAPVARKDHHVCRHK